MPSIGFGLGFRSPRRREADPPAVTWGALDPRLDFSRGSQASFVDPAGVLALAAGGMPRFDHDPVSHAPLGLLIEEQRTNLLSYSSLNPALWSSGRVSLNQSVAGPDSIANGAARVAETATTGEHHVLTPALSVAAGQTYALTTFAKPGTRRYFSLAMATTAASGAGGIVDLQTGTFSDAKANTWAALGTAIKPAAGGFFRATVRAVAGATSAVVELQLAQQPAYTGGTFSTVGAATSYAGDGTAYLDLFGFQLEAGGFATSYIPTGGAIATRAADSCTSTHADFAQWLARPEKTVVVQADCPASGTRRVFHAAKTGSEASDYISIWTSDSTVKATVAAGGVIQADLTLGTIAAGVPFKVALSFAEDTVQASLNGAAKVTNAGAALPACDKLWFGCGAAGAQLCGHLSGTWRLLNRASDVEALAA